MEFLAHQVDGIPPPCSVHIADSGVRVLFQTGEEVASTISIAGEKLKPVVSSRTPDALRIECAGFVARVSRLPELKQPWGEMIFFRKPYPISFKRE